MVRVFFSGKFSLSNFCCCFSGFDLHILLLPTCSFARVGEGFFCAADYVVIGGWGPGGVLGDDVCAGVGVKEGSVGSLEGSLTCGWRGGGFNLGGW